jgi:hypothetical protein
MKIKSGGGIQSNKLVQSQKWKQEPKPKAVNPASAAQLGRSEQFRKPPLEQGKGYETKPMAATGIANARKGPAGAAPGGMGRTIYRSGSQSPTPAPRAIGPTRDTLSEFGKDIPGRR